SSPHPARPPATHGRCRRRRGDPPQSAPHPGFRRPYPVDPGGRVAPRAHGRPGTPATGRIRLGTSACHSYGLRLCHRLHRGPFLAAFGGDGVGQAAHFASQPVLPVPDSLTYKVAPAAPSVRMYSEPTAATTTPSGDPAPVSRDGPPVLLKRIRFPLATTVSCSRTTRGDAPP